MFGLSIKEKITALILNASQNLLPNYISYCQQVMECIETLGEDEAECRFALARRNYFDDVTNAVCQFYQNANPFIYARLQMAMISPTLAGLPEETDIDSGFSAGILYGLCYYAMTERTAKYYDCSKLSHEQVDMMNLALRQNFSNGGAENDR